MNIKVVVGAVAVFAAGAAVGYLYPRAAAPEQERPAVADKGKAKDEGGELAAARKRIGELEQRIASLSAAKPKKLSLKEKATNDESVVTIDGNATNLYEELSKKMPAEQFCQVTNAFERMKQARRKRVQGKLEFLSSVDTSGMSAADRKTHEDYMKLVAKQEELMSKAKGIIPDQKSLEDLVMLQMKMKPLADVERKTLLRQMSGNLGYTGDDATVVVDTVGDIVGATSSGGLGDMISSMTDAFGGGEDGGDGKPAVEVQTQVLSL